VNTYLLNIAFSRGAPHVFFVLMIFEFSRLRIRVEILNFFAALSP